MNALYDHYQAALSLSEPYKLAGGEGTQRDFSGHMHTRVIHALAALHDDSEGEESSVDWEASAQEDEENEQESGHSEEAEVISIEEEEEEEPPLEDDRGGRAGSGSQDGGRMHTPQRQRFTSRPRAKSAKKGGQAAAAAVAAAAAERAAQSVQSPSAVATHSSPGGSGERRTRQLDIRTFLGPSSQENE